MKRALQCDFDWCLAFLDASSSICVKVVVELKILESGRARDVHSSTVGPFLVVIDYVSHPYKTVDHTYAYIIIFLVFILMCRAVIVFTIEMIAPRLFSRFHHHIFHLMLEFVPNK